RLSRMPDVALRAFTQHYDPLFDLADPVEFRMTVITGRPAVDPPEEYSIEHRLAIQRFNTALLLVMRNYLRHDLFAAMSMFGFCRQSGEALSRMTLSELTPFAPSNRCLVRPSE